MKAERLIAGRIRFKGRMAILAVAISFFVMIIAVAVSSGFRKEIRDALSSLSGDITLCASPNSILGEGAPILADSASISELISVEGVVGVNPAIYRAAIVKTDNGISGVIIKGIEGLDSLHVSIPSKLASSMGLDQGEEMHVFFVGESVCFRKFFIESVYQTYTQADGKLVVYAPIEDLRVLNAWQEGEVSALEVCLQDRFRTREGMRYKAREMGSNYVAISSAQKYSTLFDWLDLIDVNVLAILILMTIVAGFNMISGLLILLFRNIKTIGILKSLGMTDKSISRVFLRVSARLVAIGMGIGNFAALVFCLIQSKTHLIKLNPENYFVSFVPVSVDLPLIITADMLAFVVILILLLLPARFVSGIDPAKTVKSE